jgi:hypothetical protein
MADTTSLTSMLLLYVQGGVQVIVFLITLIMGYLMVSKGWIKTQKTRTLMNLIFLYSVISQILGFLYCNISAFRDNATYIEYKNVTVTVPGTNIQLTREIQISHVASNDTVGWIWDWTATVYLVS